MENQGFLKDQWKIKDSKKIHGKSRIPKKPMENQGPVTFSIAELSIADPSIDDFSIAELLIFDSLVADFSIAAPMRRFSKTV